MKRKTWAASSAPGALARRSGMAALILFALGIAGMATAQQPVRITAAQAQAEVEALIKAAKAEGELTWYSGPAEHIARRVSEAYTSKYGVRVGFVRFPSVALEQRYSNDADAGNIAADLAVNAGASATTFANEAIRKGWAESINDSALPVVRSGEFPARMNLGATAVIQIAPWTISYNTEKLKGADIPKDWPDLLKPIYKGQVLLADPRASAPYAEIWTLLMERYGEGFLRQLAGQTARQYISGVPAVQGMAAGEGTIHIPSLIPLVQGLVDKGAPIGNVVPDVNTGFESHLMMTARAKAKHPAAARLFANFLMSEEGNKILNNERGAFTVYDTARLPKQFVSPKIDASKNHAKLAELLGFK